MFCDYTGRPAGGARPHNSDCEVIANTKGGPANLSGAYQRGGGAPPGDTNYINTG